MTDEQEHPYWPCCEVITCANGWIVRQGGAYESRTVRPPDEAHVFNEWEDAQNFIRKATAVKRTNS
jgi:hypothetical protein